MVVTLIHIDMVCRSGLMAQCMDVMLCLPFLDNINSVAGGIVILEEVISPMA